MEWTLLPGLFGILVSVVWQLAKVQYLFHGLFSSVNAKNAIFIRAGRFRTLIGTAHIVGPK